MSNFDKALANNTRENLGVPLTTGRIWGFSLVFAAAVIGLLVFAKTGAL